MSNDQHPMSMNRRVPVKTAIERRVQFARFLEELGVLALLARARPGHESLALLHGASRLG